MTELWNIISNPGQMGLAQWLLLAIFLFVVVAALYFVLRLYRLIRNIGKASSGASRYQPGWTGVTKAAPRPRGQSPQEIASQQARLAREQKQGQTPGQNPAQREQDISVSNDEEKPSTSGPNRNR